MFSTDSATSSGLKTTDSAIHPRPAKLVAVTIVPAAADSTLVVYDHPSAASGTVLAKVFVKASTASQTILFTRPIEANNGIYADVTGASAEYIVYYSPM